MSSTGSTASLPQNERGPAVLAICWVFTVVALIPIVARAILRTKIASTAWRDDFILVLSMILSLIYTCIATAAVVWDVGHHQWDVSADQLQTALLLNAISSPFAAVASTTPKFALAVLIVRTFEPLRWHCRLLYFLCGFAVVVAIIGGFLVLPQCSPAAGLWDTSLASVCWAPSIIVDYSIFACAFSAFVDFVLAVYPSTCVAKLNMSHQRKFTLWILLVLGTVAGIIAIIKSTFIPGLADKSDYTYATAPLLYWTAVEANVLIAGASIPTLGPLWSRMTLGISSRSSHSSGHQSYARPPGYKRMISTERRGPRDLVYGEGGQDAEVVISQEMAVRQIVLGEGAAGPLSRQGARAMAEGVWSEDEIDGMIGIGEALRLVPEGSGPGQYGRGVRA